MNTKHQIIYDSLNDDEKIMMKLKGPRQYLDDLDVETQVLIWSNSKLLDAFATKLEQLNKVTKESK